MDVRVGVVDAKVENVRAEVGAVRTDLVAAQARHDSLVDVVNKFAGEERARRIQQEWQQIKFVSVIHVVAKEVLVCFSLNRSTWIDVRLWRVVINNVYKKHTDRKSSSTLAADETREYRDATFEETAAYPAVSTGPRVERAASAAAWGERPHHQSGRRPGAERGERSGADESGIGWPNGAHVGKLRKPSRSDGSPGEVKAGADMNQEEDPTLSHMLQHRIKRGARSLHFPSILYPRECSCRLPTHACLLAAAPSSLAAKLKQ